MDIPHTFETLSDLIDALEEGDVELRRFRLRERDVIADAEVVADVRVGVPIRSALDAASIDIEAVDVSGADTLTLDVGPLDGLLPPGCRSHDIDVQGVAVEDDATVVLDIAVSIPVESPDGTVGASTVDPATAASIPFQAYRDESVPPFDDGPYLRAIYEACETFEEMRNLIDLDVTTETVRRYMIDAGIHQPNSYRTGGSAGPGAVDGGSAEAPEEEDDADVEVLLADGIGIPDGTTIEEFIATVRRSKTLHEVQQSMGLDRNEAYDILADLNLLDLVVGRLAMEAERDVTREEIVERLRQSVA